MHLELRETMLLVFFLALIYQNSSTFCFKYHQSLYGDVAKAFNNILISKSILMKKFEVFSKVQCQAQCMHDASCMSFFHRQVEGLCQTHSIVFLDAGYGETSHGTRYYVLHEDGTVVQHTDRSYLQVNIHHKTATISQSSDNRNPNYLYRRDLDMKVTIYSNRLNWEGADRACRRLGQQLVSLDTWPKFRFVTDVLKASGFYNVKSSEFHVGLYEPGPNGIWVWKNGVSMDINSEMWCKADDQPDNGNIFSPQRRASLWNKVVCPMTLDDKFDLEKSYYICELPSSKLF